MRRAGNRGDGLTRAGEPVGDLADGERSTDEGDAAPTETEQVRGGGAAARDVVDRDRAEGAIRVAVDEHHGGAVGAQALEPFADVAEGRDEHAAHALLLEEVEVGGLALGLLVAVAEQHRDAVLGRLVFRAAGDVGEERVAGVEHDEADRTRPTGAQLAGGVVAHVAEVADGERARARPRSPRPGRGG